MRKQPKPVDFRTVCGTVNTEDGTSWTTLDSKAWKERDMEEIREPAAAMDLRTKKNRASFPEPEKTGPCMDGDPRPAVKPTTSRREFLRLAGSIAASPSALRTIEPWAPRFTASAEALRGRNRPSSVRKVRAWRTSDRERFEPIDAPVWKPATATSPTAIHLDPDQRFQKILGFGAALTDASCYLLQQLPGAERAALLKECFGMDGLRFSVARTCVGSSDYSRSAYSFDDTPEPDEELKHFSIEHDRAYILPVLRQAKEINNGLFYLSSPWSPPGWMKAGGSLLGGSMRKRYFAAYAQYFVKFLKSYAAEGVEIPAVTVQNEVDTDQDGTMPAALWGQEYEIGFVKDHLGPGLEEASLDTKIWILDHNYNLWGRAADELSDPGAYKYVDGVAWHGYAGSAQAMTRVHNMFPEKHAYWTEGGPDITAADYATDWTRWSSSFTGILRNWARCIISWNLVLDEDGNPNIGPFHCGGMVTVHSKDYAITRSGQYWALAHYSKLIERGGQVFASWGEPEGINHVAVENPDGSQALVITNRAEQQQAQCTLGALSLDLPLPPNSITSLLW